MLLLHARRDHHARYSRYLGEILRLEGFPRVEHADIEDLDEQRLAQTDLVLLPRLIPTHRERDLLVSYVSHGGKLIAFHPEKGLAEAFGLHPTYRTIGQGNGYLWIDTRQEMTGGLCAEPVQTIAPAAIWQPVGEYSVLADLRDAVNPTTVAPGAVHICHGDGEAVLFAYDLAHAVARLRQGDPASADLNSSGVDHFYRPHELFVHQLPPSQQRLPQADVHGALLARIVETLAPQPRLWYYPEATDRSVMVMTSDDDWSTVEQFETLIDGLRRYDATCSFFVVPGTKISPELISGWEQAGHSFSVHPALASDYRAGPPPDKPQALFVAEMIRENVERHRGQYGHPVRTLRNHIIRWSGYLEPVRVFAELGVRMEFNYFSVAPLPVGYLNGSGRPMRFVDTDGSLIDCYQQGTAWSEEVLLHPLFNASVHWHVDRAIRETERIIRDAARIHFTPVTVNSHPVSFATYSQPLIEANWRTAREEGMSIISADRWLDWTETREAIALESTGTGWHLRSPKGTAAVTVLLPPGINQPHEGTDATRQTLWGREYTALTFRDIGAGETRAITLTSYEREAL